MFRDDDDDDNKNNDQSNIINIRASPGVRRHAVRGTLDDVVTALSSGAWADKIYTDTLACRVAFGETHLTREGDPLTDTLASKIALWLYANPGLLVPTHMVHEAVAVVAASTRKHPVREYLRSLQWDGVPRVDTWLSRYLGVADAPYARYVGAKWLISAVARADKPGIKADHVLVLEGSQGLGKSTALRILAGEQWFSDDLHDLGDRKASAEQLQGRWIVEIGEMAAMGRTQIDAAKAFISRQVDKYRPAYARCVIDQPRSCVFAASINPNGTGYLGDTTGNRRFWPVACTAIDTVAIATDRDQLWAEAAQRYRQGEAWYPTQADTEIISAAIVEQAERETEDAWTDDVLDYCDGKTVVRTKEILQTALGLDVAKHDRLSMVRVAGILVKNGWSASRMFVNRSKIRVYRKI